jgi:hypothetical protein
VGLESNTLGLWRSHESRCQEDDLANEDDLEVARDWDHRARVEDSLDESFDAEGLRKLRVAVASTSNPACCGVSHIVAGHAGVGVGADVVCV